MKALIIVDIQNDFCPGGALAVPEGDRIIPFINQILDDFEIIVATQDWHPANHGSFASNHPNKKPGDIIDLNGLPQILWPDHCIQETYGADFHSALLRDRILEVFKKGTDPTVDSYSGFFDNGHRHSTGLEDYLKEKMVTEVWICGLATDYCVKFTALDAVKLGFKTNLLIEGTKGVNLKPGDVERAILEMKQEGIEIVESYLA